jgi:hypothetical protein
MRAIGVGPLGLCAYQVFVLCEHTLGLSILPANLPPLAPRLECVVRKTV